MNKIIDHWPNIWLRLTITESSANLTMCLPLKTLRQSSVYKENKRGDKTQPCGVPVEDIKIFDTTPLTRTLWDLLVKKSTNQHTVFRSSLKVSIKAMCFVTTIVFHCGYYVSLNFVCFSKLFLCVLNVLL